MKIDGTPPSQLGDCRWARDINQQPAEHAPLTDEQIDRLQSRPSPYTSALLSVLFLIATPVFADTLEIRTGTVATIYEGVAVDTQFHEGRGRIDFAAWTSYQTTISADGVGTDTWTVFIDGEARNDCRLVTTWSRQQSPVSIVVRCAAESRGKP